MPTKPNGDFIPGAIAVPVYPPFQDTVAQHSMDYAYGVGNPSMDTTAPAAVTATKGAVTDTTVAVSWTAAVDSGSGVASYDVYSGVTKVASITNGALSTTVTGLAANTAYSITVKVVDGAGNTSVASNALTGTTGTNEIQTVTEGGSGLTSFTLTFSGQTTGSIAAAATAATVQAAIQALSNVGAGNAIVSGSASGPYTVTFQGTLAATNVAQMTATPTGGSGTVTVTTATPGVAGS
jgi:hypothetical protein